MIINDVSDYINLFVRIAHIICNHSVYMKYHWWVQYWCSQCFRLWTNGQATSSKV